MVSTNFDLAPPSKTVDGLVAVPIDIQTITASLVFDAATSTGTGDATIDFVLGSAPGNPIFDLRQTITSAFLDGVAFPIAQLAHHDFGGGANAELRIVESVLAAGSSHTLRVLYNLGLPQASGAGSYQPGMTFSAGPRLAFNFGFTDLGAGRYLEAWVPANLIFDQYDVSLELQVLNTTIGHTLITNGTVTALGANHWLVAFPARSSAFSTLIELRATDTVIGQSDAVTLPLSGTTVSIEAWKLSTGVANLGTVINSLKTFLADNESSTGPYLHGTRFVAFVNVGGMEYDGGTTTATSSLRHETFHSWWGRGLKAASQPDAWWDEAWTVYNDNGATGSFPFDFTDPAVELCPRNPWVRITAPGSYVDGNRFFEGVASAAGAANLRSHMSAYYESHNSRPTTTADLEAFLVSRSGREEIVDGFHRFVYGFADPNPAPDLWLRDDPGHTGPDLWGGPFWDSPDVWVRNLDDGGVSHQQPEFGQDNWFYAQVRNRSATAAARHFLVTFNVKSFAGTQFVYPDDFLPSIAAAAGFDLAAGSSAIVKARWPASLVPPAGTHACALAAVITRSDHPGAGLHVWEHNNLAQKNLTIVDLLPNDWLVLPFVVRNFQFQPRRVWLEILRPPRFEKLSVELMQISPESRKVALEAARTEEARLNAAGRGLDCAGRGLRDPAPPTRIWTSRTPDALAARRFTGASTHPFPAGPSGQMPLALAAGGQHVLGLKVHVPSEAKAGDEIHVNLGQRDAETKRLEGGLAIQIHVRDRMVRDSRA